MLKFETIGFAYDGEHVIRDVSFTAAPGEITCLVGPSGCGKTTLLRLAAGLLECGAGRITLDGVTLSGPGIHVAPESRPVGLVFQEGALFPHLTVAGNVGFGLPPAKREARVAPLLSRIGLEGYGDRYPHTLSGGQRQRVALARALAPQPAALLFDEPYANLDPHLRQSLRREVRHTLREAGTIGVFVTHDPDEVAALADQVVVMHQGRIEQVGTPRELYDAPASGRVARLFGAAQRLDARLSEGRLETAAGDWPVACLRAPHPDDGDVVLNVRPDDLVLIPDGAFEVTDVRMAGPDDLVAVALPGGLELFARVARPHSFAPGRRARIKPRDGRILAEAAHGD